MTLSSILRRSRHTLFAGLLPLLHAGTLHAQERVAFPVFEWSNPSPALAEEVEGRGAPADLHTPTLVQAELRSFRKGKDTRSVSLVQEGARTTLAHDPGSGYSEWTLPNFLPPSGEVPEHWHSIVYEFRLPEGTSLADYKLPLQFRTSLSPTNKIELDLRRDGTFRINAVELRDGERKTSRHVTERAITAVGPTRVRYLLSSRGDWAIHVNGEPFDSGSIPAGYVTRGRSNKFWFEGTQHVLRLAVSELYRPDDAEHARGLPEAGLDVMDAALARSLGRYVGGYEDLGAADRDDWSYLGHERSYVRRMGVESEGGSFTAYRVGLVVTGTRSGGGSLSLPFQYEVAIDDEDGSIGIINLYFNDTSPYVLTDFEELFPDHLVDGKVVP